MEVIRRAFEPSAFAVQTAAPSGVLRVNANDLRSGDHWGRVSHAPVPPATSSTGFSVAASRRAMTLWHVPGQPGAVSCRISRGSAGNEAGAGVDPVGVAAWDFESSLVESVQGCHTNRPAAARDVTSAAATTARRRRAFSATACGTCAGVGESRAAGPVTVRDCAVRGSATTGGAASGTGRSCAVSDGLSDGLSGAVGRTAGSGGGRSCVAASGSQEPPSGWRTVRVARKAVGVGRSAGSLDRQAPMASRSSPGTAVRSGSS